MKYTFHTKSGKKCRGNCELIPKDGMTHNKKLIQLRLDFLIK